MKSGATVGLVDYGAGNVQSLANAVAHIGAEVRVFRSPSDADALTHLILPGVGAFGFCADRLRSSLLLPFVSEWALDQQRPILGICVGMQLLADTSEEMGRQTGLGWVGGRVERLTSTSPEIRVPHVGWNTVEFMADFGECPLGLQRDFYFDHSYALTRPERGEVLGRCVHGRPFCAAVRRGNVVGCQFHPEKSQAAGLRFLRSFVSLR